MDQAQLREATAHHEAGHFVATYILRGDEGAEHYTVTIKPRSDTLGSNDGDAPPAFQSGDPDECEAAALEMFAGYAAHIRLEPSQDVPATLVSGMRHRDAGP